MTALPDLTGNGGEGPEASLSNTRCPEQGLACVTGQLWGGVLGWALADAWTTGRFREQREKAFEQPRLMGAARAIRAIREPSQKERGKGRPWGF